MKCISAVMIGKLIEAHMEHDEQKFLSYARFMAEAYEESGEKQKARIIRSKIDNSYKNDTKIVSDSAGKECIPIYVEAGCQSVLAKMKLVAVRELEEIGIFGKSIAVLYDIEEQLRPIPMYSKVKLLGKECMFYLGVDKELGQRVLIQVECKDYEFWFGSGD